MTVPTGTFQVYTQVNIREDLINAIYNVDPYKTPFFNMCKKTKAEQTYHEWNTDSLAAQDTSNARVEGDNPSNITVAPTIRLGNYTQISDKTIQISGTSQAVIAAGGSNKMGYQLLKKSKEVKRDLEGMLTKNVAKAAGSSSTARISAGIPSWLGTNTVFGAGGANPAALLGANTRTDGTQTAITEANLKSVLQKIYSASGESPEYGLVSPVNKQNISAFSGPGTRFVQVEDRVLQTAIDIYASDFGDVKLVPDIFIRSRDTFWINPAYVRVAYLRPFNTVPLAKTGDSDQKQLIVEWTLELGNEKAQGAIYDTNG